MINISGDVCINFHWKHWGNAWTLHGLLLRQPRRSFLLCVQIDNWTSTGNFKGTILKTLNLKLQQMLITRQSMTIAKFSSGNSCWYSFNNLIGLESTLRLVRIFFDTASFDEIERDTEIKLTNQISLVGGTMGLFTGFSIISGIELIYFAAKVFFRSTTAPLVKTRRT